MRRGRREAIKWKSRLGWWVGTGGLSLGNSHYRKVPFFQWGYSLCPHCTLHRADLSVHRQTKSMAVPRAPIYPPGRRDGGSSVVQLFFFPPASWASVLPLLSYGTISESRKPLKPLRSSWKRKNILPWNLPIFVCISMVDAYLLLCSVQKLHAAYQIHVPETSNM